MRVRVVTKLSSFADGTHSLTQKRQTSEAGSPPHFISVKTRLALIFFVSSVFGATTRVVANDYFSYYWEMPSERVLEVKSMASFAKRIRQKPDEVSLMHHGTIEVESIGKQIEIDGKPFFEPRIKVSFQGSRFSDGGRTAFQGIVQLPPYPMISVSQLGERFVEDWTWYRLPGNVVFQVHEPNQFPQQLQFMGKVPQDWLQKLPIVLQKRREHDEWFRQVPTLEQRRSIELEIEKGPALWSLILVQRLLEIDSISWQESLDWVMKTQDRTAVALLLLDRIGRYEHDQRPWKAILGDKPTRAMLWDAAALACVTTAYSYPVREAQGYSVVYFFAGKAVPNEKQLLGKELSSNAGYQWAHQLALEFDLLPESIQSDMQYGLFRQLLNLMKVRRGLTREEIEAHLKERGRAK